MKIIKLAIFVVLVIVVLNYFGLLNPDFSQKVDTAVETTLDKVNNIEYKGKKLTDMTLKEIAANVKSDIEYITEEVVTEDGIKLSGKNLKVLVTPTQPILLQAELDAADTGAVESVEKLIKDFTGLDYKIPEETKAKGNLHMYVEKTDGEFAVKFR